MLTNLINNWFGVDLKSSTNQVRPRVSHRQTRQSTPLVSLVAGWCWRTYTLPLSGSCSWRRNCTISHLTRTSASSWQWKLTPRYEVFGPFSCLAVSRFYCILAMVFVWPWDNQCFCVHCIDKLTLRDHSFIICLSVCQSTCL